MIVKTIESNAQNVYEARRRILGLAQEVPTCETKSGWLPAGQFISECSLLSAEIILFFLKLFFSFVNFCFESMLSSAWFLTVSLVVLAFLCNHFDATCPFNICYFKFLL